MPVAPYSGPEVASSRRLLEDLVPRLPEPVMLLGGWGVFLTVRTNWLKAFGQDYFGSRDVDLGFESSADLSLESLKRGNLPKTVEFLESEGFVRRGVWGMVKYASYLDNRPLTEGETKRMGSHEFYRIAVDLIAGHDRRDLREVAGLHPVVEPALDHAFRDPVNRKEFELRGQVIWVPAPHVLVVTKLNSLPKRGEDDKVKKDLSDLYALIGFSGASPSDLGRDAAALDPGISWRADQARKSPLLEEAAHGLDIDPDTLGAAIGALGLGGGKRPERRGKLWRGKVP